MNVLQPTLLVNNALPKPSPTIRPKKPMNETKDVAKRVSTMLSGYAAEFMIVGCKYQQSIRTTEQAMELTLRSQSG